MLIRALFCLHCYLNTPASMVKALATAASRVVKALCQQTAESPKAQPASSSWKVADCKFERDWAADFSEEGSFQVSSVSVLQQQGAHVSKQGTND